MLLNQSISNTGQSTLSVSSYFKGLSRNGERIVITANKHMSTNPIVTCGISMFMSMSGNFCLGC